MILGVFLIWKVDLTWVFGLGAGWEWRDFVIMISFVFIMNGGMDVRMNGFVVFQGAGGNLTSVLAAV